MNFEMDPYRSLASEAMQAVWQRSQRSYQVVAIPHLLKMMAGELCPEPELIVQSTGSGKNTVHLTAAVIDSGVSIIVENTLALESD